MVAKRRLKLQGAATVDSAAAPVHLTSADSSHKGFDSPATRLQTRLEAALTTAGGAYAIEPVIETWPASIRLAVLFGAAVASWFIVWEAAKLLI